jgi:DNA-binding GntR family transcriptional regulator
MPALKTVPLKPPKRQSLSQAVADSLRDGIYAGRFQPGQRIGQINVAEELGVSQTTARDALVILEYEGLVQRAVNQGAVVTQLSRSDIEEITSLRGNLEAMAVRRLIRQGKPEHLELLAQNIRAMKASAGPHNIADLDLQFHELLLRLADHSRLLSCWQTLRTQIKLLMVANNLRDASSPRKTVENHEELLKRIRAWDEEAAVAHLEHTLSTG